MKKEYYTKGKTVGKEQLGWQGEHVCVHSELVVS